MDDSGGKSDPGTVYNSDDEIGSGCSGNLPFLARKRRLKGRRNSEGFISSDFATPPIHHHSLKLTAHSVEGTHSFAMAAAFVSKKAFTAPPTVRTLASGVPSASLVNLAVRSPAGHGHEHGHGAVGPRSDAPSRWAGGLSSNNTTGLVSRTYSSGGWRHFREMEH